MRPLVNAKFAGESGDSLRFDCEAGWQCRVFVLADDLVRVLFLRDETLKEPRTWMVVPAGGDAPWEGGGRPVGGAFARPPLCVVAAASGGPPATAAPTPPPPLPPLSV